MMTFRDAFLSLATLALCATANAQGNAVTIGIQPGPVAHQRQHALQGQVEGGVDAQAGGRLALGLHRLRLLAVAPDEARDGSDQALDLTDQQVFGEDGHVAFHGAGGRGCQGAPGAPGKQPPPSLRRRWLYERAKNCPPPCRVPR